MPAQDSPVPTEYPQAIGRTARRVLALEGYTRYDQLTEVTPAQLLKIHGVGPKAIRILEQELAARGLSFAGTVASTKGGGRDGGGATEG